ncbi:Dihydroxyacetone synthase [Tulasnella sp. 408]|nr:Dihydroxyacetone synthase [Tulasnella sp. 408]
MLFRTPVLVVALVTSCVLAKTCQPGEYRGPDKKCYDCAAGYVSPPLRIRASRALLAKARTPPTRNVRSALQDTITTSQEEPAASAILDTSTTYSNDDCKKYAYGRPEPVESCKMVADNVCPNPTDDGPSGTAITRKKRGTRCQKGWQLCSNYLGVRGSECVDTQNDPESCGGCVSAVGKSSGTDCTAMEGVGLARCVKGSCVIGQHQRSPAFFFDLEH